jgi:hypothetical protein
MNTTYYTDKWLKVVMVVLLVFAGWHILQITLHFFNPPGHHYDEAIVAAAIINTILLIGLAYSLKVAHDRRRPALFIPFLVLNLIAIILVGATLIYLVIGLLNRDPYVAARASSNAKDMASAMTATHKHHLSQFQAPFVALMTALIFAILIFFEFVVYHAWLEVRGGAHHHPGVHQGHGIFNLKGGAHHHQPVIRHNHECC